MDSIIHLASSTGNSSGIHAGGQRLRLIMIDYFHFAEWERNQTRASQLSRSFVSKFLFESASFDYAPAITAVILIGGNCC